jgi:HNH endonuclease
MTPINRTYKDDIEDRFWSKVDIGSPDECWPWTAGPRSKGRGYGGFKLNNPRRTISSHRMAYELTYGLEPYDPENPIVVRHKCDNEPCCNPAHLELGTPLDNVHDRDDRGRNGCAKRVKCPKGHKYTSDNTYLETTKQGREKRHCKTCREKQQRDRYKVVYDSEKSYV